MRLYVYKSNSISIAEVEIRKYTVHFQSIFSNVLLRPFAHNIVVIFIFAALVFRLGPFRVTEISQLHT